MALAAGPSSVDPLRYAAGLLAVAVGDDDNSRLYWELIDRGLADAAELGHNDFDGTGAWTTYLCCQPEDLTENLDSMMHIFREVNRDGITEDELRWPRTKWPHGLFYRANVPWAGSRRWEATGFTPANTVRSKTNCDRCRRSRSAIFVDCLMSIRSL